MKLNAGQKRELETKYKDKTVFDSIAGVPVEYPIFAFRNVFLTQWYYKDGGICGAVIAIICNVSKIKSINTKAVSAKKQLW